MAQRYVASAIGNTRAVSLTNTDQEDARVSRLCTVTHHRTHTSTPTPTPYAADNNIISASLAALLDGLAYSMNTKLMSGTSN